MGASNGGSQLALTSQWASKKTITSPVASLAPLDLVRIKPCLSEFLKSLTLPSHCSMYDSKSPFKFSKFQRIN